mmetsp:Transcript_12913/g.27457  ORF Transcript_12913/g.27457 Transcript_12913/m.27457 type:complete len:732 (-) Transcript_12913:141-2336(-)
MKKHHPQHHRHHLRLLLPLLFDGTTPLSYLDHNLRPKPDLQHELAHLASNEFSPPLSFSTLEPGKPVHAPDDVRHLLRSLVECTSPLIEWSTDLIHQMGYSTYKELFDNQILQMPYIYKHYIDKNNAGESFGTDGKYTKELLEKHQRTMAFWTEADIDDSISTDDILLLSMHGEDLLDMDKLVPTVQRMFDFEDVNDVVAFASTIRDFVAALPEGGGNPLLTMNAIATRAARRRDLPIDGLRDSIVVGDGVLRFLEDTGLASSGPEFVHAHEFGHHLQFEMDAAMRSSRYAGTGGYADDGDARRKEMMADAIAAYFLAHDRGGNMGEEEIEEFVATSYATGDCSVMDEDHHGTPEQRKCAAAWGASQAAPDGGGLVDPEAFVREFDEVYGRILALDGVECALVLEDPEEEEVVAGGGWEEATGDEADGGYGAGQGVDIPYFQPPEITLNIDIPDNSNSGVQVINQPEIDLGMNLPNEESQWDEQEEEGPEAADPVPYIPPQIDQAYVPPVVDVPPVQVVPPTQGQSAYKPQIEEIIQQAPPPPPATTVAASTTQPTEAPAAAATSTSIATNNQEPHYYNTSNNVDGDPHSGPTNQPPTEPQQQEGSQSAGTLSDSYLRNRGSPSLRQSDLDYASPLQETISDNGPVFGDDQDPIIVKTIGPPDQTRSFNMMSGVKEFSSEDCGLPWVYCSPEMEEMAAASGGDGSRRGGKSVVVFCCVVGLMTLLTDGAGL